MKSMNPANGSPARLDFISPHFVSFLDEKKDFRQGLWFGTARMTLFLNIACQFWRCAYDDAQQTRPAIDFKM
ncbi:hypothetical protein PUN4_540058 [Paraburkholderia unamae]|nr:hypothetical protein PUN4_540058 [Paraburkholderia unamae]